MSGTNVNTNTLPDGSQSNILRTHGGVGAFHSNELTFTRSTRTDTANAMSGHGKVDAADISNILTSYGVGNADTVDIIASVSNYEVDEAQPGSLDNFMSYGAPLFLEGKTVQIITNDAAIVMPAVLTSTLVQNIKLEWGESEVKTQNMWFATLNSDAQISILKNTARIEDSIILNQNVSTEKGAFNNGSLIVGNGTSTFTIEDMAHIEINGAIVNDKPDVQVTVQEKITATTIELKATKEIKFTHEEKWTLAAPLVNLSAVNAVEIHVGTNGTCTWDADKVILSDTTMLSSDFKFKAYHEFKATTNFEATDLTLTTTCDIAITVPTINISKDLDITACAVAFLNESNITFETYAIDIRSAEVNMTASDLIVIRNYNDFEAGANLSLNAGAEINFSSSENIIFSNSTAGLLNIIFSNGHALTFDGDEVTYEDENSIIEQFGDNLSAEEKFIINSNHVGINSNNTTVTADGAITIIIGANALYDTLSTNVTATNIQFEALQGSFSVNVGGDNDDDVKVVLGGDLHITGGGATVGGIITMEENALHMNHEITYERDDGGRAFKPNDIFKWDLNFLATIVEEFADPPLHVRYVPINVSDFISNPISDELENDLRSKFPTHVLADVENRLLARDENEPSGRARGGCAAFIREYLSDMNVRKWRDIRGTVWVAKNKVRRFEVEELKHGGSLSAQRICGLSDKRFKKNITLMTSSYLDKVKQLTPVSWNWKTRKSKQAIGFIAQDAANILPNIVVGGSNNKYYSIDYTQLISTLPLICAQLDELESLIPQ